MYTTKATWIGKEYGCRVFKNGVAILEGRAASRELIGATFRDLLRTLDKLDCDAFTKAARNRNNELSNIRTSVKHIWL